MAGFGRKYGLPRYDGGATLTVLKQLLAFKDMEEHFMVHVRQAGNAAHVCG